jgi:Uri superfamily endonuclease
MREIGYPKLYSILTTADFIDYLKTRPELIDTWVYYSEDIRHNPAWGLYQDKQGKWTVDYLDSKNSIRKAFVYADKFGACTKMIIETFESIRGNDN